MEEVFGMYYTVLTALFGLVFGSFLNCMAMRIVRHEDFIHGRSHCMACGHELAAIDLVPVASWLFTRGRCRYCGAGISIRYPLSELLFAGLAVGIYLRCVWSAETLLNLVLLGSLFTLSLVDMESFEIPDGCILAGLAAWCAAAPFMWKEPGTAVGYLLSGFVCGAVMLILSLGMDRVLGRESLGGGDIKLFALLGLYTGLPGALFLVLLSCIVGLLAAGVMGLVKRDKRDTECAVSGPEGAIPFGPAISTAGYLMLLFGEEITHWYFGFF